MKMRGMLSKNTNQHAFIDDDSANTVSLRDNTNFGKLMSNPDNTPDQALYAGKYLLS